MKNFKKLSSVELKKIQGGQAPACCLSWNPATRECRRWDFNCLNP
ncbi:bacteriocin class II family protein [Chryseobacterium vrystaatense]|nr:bacteriocin class II family protein [Chryseobacterium vrystaatense]